ncbi:MAG: VTC domain-containing protein [Dehalococcoidia bacterium]
MANDTLLDEVPAASQFRHRIERKFYIAPREIGSAYAVLRQICRPDKEYPVGRINSLYFDTSDLDQHERSASGEYKKDKVRIRWYGEQSQIPEMVSVFLELKSKRGFQSFKKRQRYLVSRENLLRPYISAGIVERRTLVDKIAQFGHFPEKLLRPIIVISYLRYRFTEMVTGIRVSLDYNISSTFVARELGYGERDLPLRGGVVEVKGPNIELPMTLRRMKMLNTDWSRFSKYSHCIDAHMTEPGSVARLWPSGRNGGNI